jgi:hypothetical protein
MFETYRMLGAERERELRDLARRANARAVKDARDYSRLDRFRTVLATRVVRKAVRWRPT